MKAFHITYKGLWLGGKAVVIAKTKKTALRLVEEHYNTQEFVDAEVVDEFELDEPKVLFNDNGNY